MSRSFPLKNNENFIFSLRTLYDSYGYTHYKMSKFEEYGLYSKNMDFLVSDGIITFTDTNGKLMALKPDVTLSIIKNTNGSGKAINKLYYNENVYRVSKGTHTFREIMQVGLECIGDIDGYCIFEVLTLAAKSLAAVSDSSVLDISHLGILSAAADCAGVPEGDRAEVFRLIGEKNLPELGRKCASLGLGEEAAQLLKKLICVHGAPHDVIPELRKLPAEITDTAAFDEFCRITASLEKTVGRVNIDLSVVEDLHYYNGIVFKGFVEGVPNSVLSGGQYDTLMRRMKRSEGAIGFAVYTDMLDRLSGAGEKYDADVLLLYPEDASFEEVEAAAAQYRDKGENVLAVRNIPEGIRYRTLVNTDGGEVKTDENDA